MGENMDSMDSMDSMDMMDKMDGSHTIAEPTHLLFAVPLRTVAEPARRLSIPSMVSMVSIVSMAGHAL